MAKTFETKQGLICNVDNYSGVGTDEDIVSGVITGYYVESDGERAEEISEDVYKALKKYYKQY